jgi:hypothetical protein
MREEWYNIKRRNFYFGKSGNFYFGLTEEKEEKKIYFLNFVIFSLRGWCCQLKEKSKVGDLFVLCKNYCEKENGLKKTKVEKELQLFAVEAIEHSEAVSYLISSKFDPSNFRPEILKKILSALFIPRNFFNRLDKDSRVGYFELVDQLVQLDPSLIVHDLANPFFSFILELVISFDKNQFFYDRAHFYLTSYLANFFDTTEKITENNENPKLKAIEKFWSLFQERIEKSEKIIYTFTEGYDEWVVGLMHAAISSYRKKTEEIVKEQNKFPPCFTELVPLINSIVTAIPALPTALKLRSNSLNKWSYSYRLARYWIDLIEIVQSSLPKKEFFKNYSENVTQLCDYVSKSGCLKSINRINEIVDNSITKDKKSLSIEEAKFYLSMSYRMGKGLINIFCQDELMQALEVVELLSTNLEIFQGIHPDPYNYITILQFLQCCIENRKIEIQRIKGLGQEVFHNAGITEFNLGEKKDLILDIDPAFSKEAIEQTKEISSQLDALSENFDKKIHRYRESLEINFKGKAKKPLNNLVSLRKLAFRNVACSNTKCNHREYLLKTLIKYDLSQLENTIKSTYIEYLTVLIRDTLLCEKIETNEFKKNKLHCSALQDFGSNLCLHLKNYFGISQDEELLIQSETLAFFGLSKLADIRFSLFPIKEEVNNLGKKNCPKMKFFQI